MACPHSGTSTASLSCTSAIWRSTASMSSLGLDLDSLPWLELFLGFQVAVQLLHSWLDYRQLKVRLHPGAVHMHTLHSALHGRGHCMGSVLVAPDSRQACGSPVGFGLPGSD